LFREMRTPGGSDVAVWSASAESDQAIG